MQIHILVRSVRYAARLVELCALSSSCQMQRTADAVTSAPAAGNLLATASGDLVYLGESCLDIAHCLSRYQGLAMALRRAAIATTMSDPAADFGMMSSAPKDARLAIIAHVTHLVNRDYDVSWLHANVLRYMLISP
jgi:hypothetical protein